MSLALHLGDFEAQHVGPAGVLPRVQRQVVVDGAAGSQHDGILGLHRVAVDRGHLLGAVGRF